MIVTEVIITGYRSATMIDQLETTLVDILRDSSRERFYKLTIYIKVRILICINIVLY